VKLLSEISSAVWVPPEEILTDTLQLVEEVHGTIQLYEVEERLVDMMDAQCCPPS
jgi:hypothetical protein